jgi:hypothetical protein
MFKKFVIFIFSVIIFQGCVKEPILPEGNKTFSLSGEFALILGEGLIGNNNASLTLIEFESGNASINFFEACNNFPLGDIANDAVIYDNFFYVLVSNSKVFYQIDLITGKVKNKLLFEGESFPRKFIIYYNSAYITDAYKSMVYKVDLNEMKILKSVKVGPQPEGITQFGGKLFIVNSGWGDVNKNAPDASTISIIDAQSMVEINKINSGKNPVEIIADTINQYLYVNYYNLPSLKDSLGGIVQYNINSLNKINEWRGNYSSLKLSCTGDSILFLKGGFQQKDKVESNSIQLIDLRRNSIKTIIVNDKLKENWYNFEIDYKRNYLWISNAGNFQSEGEVLIYPLNALQTNLFPIKSFKTGINPNKILIKNNAN